MNLNLSLPNSGNTLFVAGRYRLTQSVSGVDQNHESVFYDQNQFKVPGIEIPPVSSLSHHRLRPLTESPKRNCG